MLIVVLTYRNYFKLKPTTVEPVTIRQNGMNDEQTSDKLQGAPYHTMTLEARVLQKITIQIFW